MRQHSFGKLWPVSALTLGGGGLGMVWGETTFAECVATVHDAVAAGINLIDLAPRYGDGKAEEVVGEAFGGQLPEGVRVTSKCNLGNAPRAEIEPILRQSIEGSLKRVHLSGLDLFFLHSNVVPDEAHIARRADAAQGRQHATVSSAQRALCRRQPGNCFTGRASRPGSGNSSFALALVPECRTLAQRNRE